MSSSLDNEDLENVPLVRMEDVQPSRERIIDCQSLPKDDDDSYETYIIDDIECVNECIVDDDEDSNIGSMVSLHSEDVYEEDSSSQELIIPEVLEIIKTDDVHKLMVFEDKQKQEGCEAYLVDGLESFNACKEEVLETGYVEVPVVQDDVEQQIDAHIKATRELRAHPIQYTTQLSSKTPKQRTVGAESQSKKFKLTGEAIIRSPSRSWPTLEILPGGVIKPSDKLKSESYLYPDKIQETVSNPGDMMYACAKCSQTFKYLFCLVKHVKWHEDQKKIMKDPELGKLTAMERELVNLKRERIELDKIYRKQKLEIFSRIGVAISKFGKAKTIVNK